MIYLASPYRHPDPDMVRRRVKLTSFAVIKLAQRGFPIYSPVIHGHAIDMEGRRSRRPVPSDQYWLDHGIEMLELCGEMWVLMLAGWQDSEGIKGELAACDKRRLNVLYLDHALNFVEPPSCQSLPVGRPTQG